MLRTVAQDVLGTTTVINTVKNAEGEVTETIEYDFGQPFTRFLWRDAIIKYGPDAAQCAEIFKDPENHFDALVAYAKKVHVKIPENCVWGAGKFLCEIFEETAEHKLIQPTFITEYPWEVSPLARRNDVNPFIQTVLSSLYGGRELANGFSERMTLKIRRRVLSSG